MANILAVDDDHDLCALLKTALERDGHTVETRTSGTQLTDTLCRWADCILLDVMMPGEDGFAVCRRIRTQTETGQHRRLIGAGCQKQDRRVGLGADAAADGKAVLTGHHHIQQDAVRPAAERIGQLCAGGARFYGVAVTLQRCF